MVETSSKHYKEHRMQNWFNKCPNIQLSSCVQRIQFEVKQNTHKLEIQSKICSATHDNKNRQIST